MVYIVIKLFLVNLELLSHGISCANVEGEEDKLGWVPKRRGTSFWLKMILEIRQLITLKKLRITLRNKKQPRNV